MRFINMGGDIIHFDFSLSLEKFNEIINNSVPVEDSTLEIKDDYCIWHCKDSMDKNTYKIKFNYHKELDQVSYNGGFDGFDSVTGEITIGMLESLEMIAFHSSGNLSGIANTGLISCVKHGIGIDNVNVIFEKADPIFDFRGIKKE